MDISFLKEVITTANKIALGTALDNKVDVRIVNFVWDEKKPNTLYFSSVKTSPALAVYDQNPDISFITIPHDGTVGNPYVKASHVKVEHSDKKMEELLPIYLKTIPNYQQVWDAIGSKLIVFELKVTDLYVDAGVGQDKKMLHF